MNKKYMSAAIEQAKIAAQKGEVPVGAVIVKDDEIIAAAHNRCEELNDATAHAEMLAIIEAEKKLGNFRLNGCQLYVTLEPCPMCVGAAINSRISEIVYGASDFVKGALGSVVNLCTFDFPNKPEIFGGVCESQTKDILTEFFKNRRNKEEKQNSKEEKNL